jgi:hypothetical protein
MLRALALNAVYLSVGVAAFFYWLGDARRRGTLIGMGE